MSRDWCPDHNTYYSSCPHGMADRAEASYDRIADALERIADALEGGRDLSGVAAARRQADLLFAHHSADNGLRVYQAFMRGEAICPVCAEAAKP